MSISRIQKGKLSQSKRRNSIEIAKIYLKRDSLLLKLKQLNFQLMLERLSSLRRVLDKWPKTHLLINSTI